jgi:hypothetical protein
MSRPISARMACALCSPMPVISSSRSTGVSSAASVGRLALLRSPPVPPSPRERVSDSYSQWLEKLLEDALIKISAVASTLDTLSTRDMVEALIAGERDPRGSPTWRAAR